MENLVGFLLTDKSEWESFMEMMIIIITGWNMNKLCTF